MLVILCKTCGKDVLAYPCDVKSGRKKFCSKACLYKSGCNGSHGMSGTRLYSLWCHMKSRCEKGSRCSAYYYDRGIRVCEEWEKSFEAFRDWAEANGYDDSLELDRKDNDGGYQPDNCRWATRSQQMTNTRKRANAKTSRFKGVSWCANVGKWRMQIKGLPSSLHVIEEEAARAYDREAVRLFGAFANTNFKERGVPS